jgi:hypothetical protein
MIDQKFIETIAEIAYIAGVRQYYSGDSRADISDFLFWAEEFEQINAEVDWTEEDYISSVERFADEKIDASNMLARLLTTTP